MRSFALKVVIEEDRFENGRPAFHASCPAIPGCRTWGYTYDEALTNIREAIELCVDALLAEGKELALDSNQGVVEVPSPAVVVNV
jgi:predicted RNase H-like HicB family nuclease